jgi:hypothetical protein
MASATQDSLPHSRPDPFLPYTERKAKVEEVWNLLLPLFSLLPLTDGKAR